VWAWVYALIQLAGAIVIRKRLETLFIDLNSLSLALFAICVVWALVSIGSLLQETLTLKQEIIRMISTGAIMMYVVLQVNGPILAVGGLVATWAGVSYWILSYHALKQITNNSKSKNKKAQ